MELTLIEHLLSALAVATLITGPMLWVTITRPPEPERIRDREWDSLEPVERRHPSMGNVPKW